jgi:hypothetical protein
MMTDHTYHLKAQITVIGAEEDDREPSEYVADAVQRLLEDNSWEWLLEAIGHPHPKDFSIKVESTDLVRAS